MIEIKYENGDTKTITTNEFQNTTQEPPVMILTSSENGKIQDCPNIITQEQQEQIAQLFGFKTFKEFQKNFYFSEKQIQQTKENSVLARITINTNKQCSRVLEATVISVESTKNKKYNILLKDKTNQDNKSEIDKNPIFNYQIRALLNMLEHITNTILFNILQRKEISTNNQIILQKWNEITKSLLFFFNDKNLIENFQHQNKLSNVVINESLISNEIKTLAEKHQTKLDIVQQENMPECITYKDLIQKALFEIIKNAIIFHDNTHNLTSKVSIDFSYNEKEIIIKVEDNGIGISKSDLNKILYPLYTVNTINDTSPGIGLSMAQICITQIQGNLSIESELKQGTTVTITIPRNLNIEISILNNGVEKWLNKFIKIKEKLKTICKQNIIKKKNLENLLLGIIENNLYEKILKLIGSEINAKQKGYNNLISILKNLIKEMEETIEYFQKVNKKTFFNN